MSIHQRIDQGIVPIVPVDQRLTVQHTPPLRPIARFVDMLSVWSEKRQGRRALREMQDWQLRDIGLSPADVAREISKSRFWD
jgi:uncharacterized protein YjiS (DUF1127 family)